MGLFVVGRVHEVVAVAIGVQELHVDLVHVNLLDGVGRAETVLEHGTGAMFEHRFRSPDPIEKVNVDEVNMEFLYADGDSYYFMDTSNYEQTHLTRDTLGDAVDYLTSTLQIKVELLD